MSPDDSASSWTASTGVVDGGDKIVEVELGVDAACFALGQRSSEGLQPCLALLEEAKGGSKDFAGGPVRAFSYLSIRKFDEVVTERDRRVLHHRGKVPKFGTKCTGRTTAARPGRLRHRTGTSALAERQNRRQPAANSASVGALASEYGKLDGMATYVERHASTLIQEALADTRVVVVNGARQSGKSTLVQRLIRARADVDLRRLDRSVELAAARLDPERYVLFDGLLVIDEIQRAPELILPIKVRVDDDPRPGQYLLTGSARLLGLRSLPDALVGRKETIELWPFSQAELIGRRSAFIDVAFDDPTTAANTRRAPSEHRSGYVERLVVGGFPEAHERQDRRRTRFFASYLEDLVDRDVTQLGDIERREQLSQLIALLAAGAGQLFVADRLASKLGLSAKTVERYVTLFEEVFLVKRLPAWSNSSTGRVVRTRKLVFVDSGLAAHVVGRSAARLERADPLIGPMLENFVLSELSRLAPLSEATPTLLHYRTRDGVEVDAVLERRDGAVVGIEVKASGTIRAEDVAGLVHLRERAGEDFAAGFVLYTGTVTRSLGDRLWAAPIDSLWTW